MELNHKETLVRVNTQNQLVDAPSVTYTKVEAMNSLLAFGTEDDQIKLTKDERLISLSQLMVSNIDAYTKVLVAA